MMPCRSQVVVLRSRTKTTSWRAVLWESRYQCAAVHCGSCPLAAQCLRRGSSSRMIKRLEGQERLDAQRAKMSDPEFSRGTRDVVRQWELGFADARYHRGLQRFHGPAASPAPAPKTACSSSPKTAPPRQTPASCHKLSDYANLKAARSPFVRGEGGRRPDEGSFLRLQP